MQNKIILLFIQNDCITSVHMFLFNVFFDQLALFSYIWLEKQLIGRIKNNSKTF